MTMDWKWPTGTDNELELDSVRVRVESVLETEGERDGTRPLEPTLLMLPIVAVESRRELATLVVDMRDMRRRREDESSEMVSSSVIGDGPGTGGSGEDGGRERGGPHEGGPREGDGGIKDGGTGKDSRRTGTWFGWDLEEEEEEAMGVAGFSRRRGL